MPARLSPELQRYLLRQQGYDLEEIEDELGSVPRAESAVVRADEPAPPVPLLPVPDIESGVERQEEQPRDRSAELWAAQEADKKAALWSGILESVANVARAGAGQQQMQTKQWSEESALKRRTDAERQEVSDWLEAQKVSARRQGPDEVRDELRRAQAAHALALAEKARTPRPAPEVGEREKFEQRERQIQAQLGLARSSLGLRQEEASRARTEAEAGKQLPSSTATDLADADVAIAQLDGLPAEFERLGQGGWTGWIAGKGTDIFGLESTDAAEFNRIARLAMQGVGKIMEGGKLAAGDELKYRGMLPRAGMSQLQAQAAVRRAQDYLRSLRETRLRELAAQGYRTGPSRQPSGGHGKVVSELDGLREYEDGHVEEIR